MAAYSSVPRLVRTSSRTLLIACAVTALSCSTVAAPAAVAQSPAASLGQAASSLASPFGQLLGSAGDSAAPLAQTVGSANGSLGNPGPLASVPAPVSCRPTVAHPRPVLLLHGTYANGDQLGTTIGATLRSRGFCVVAPTYGAYAFAPQRGGLAPARESSAPQVAQVIDQMIAATGASQVDIVGFSQGAAIGGYVAKVLRPARVGTVVSFAGYWGADPTTLLPFGIDTGTGGSVLDTVNLGGVADLLPGSAFMTAWMAPNGTPFGSGRSYTLIASTFDPIMNPTFSFPSAQALAAGRSAGAVITQIVLQDGCPVDHAIHDTIMKDPRVADLVTNALTPTAPVPVRCSAFA